MIQLFISVFGYYGVVQVRLLRIPVIKVEGILRSDM